MVMLKTYIEAARRNLRLAVAEMEDDPAAPPDPDAQDPTPEPEPYLIVGENTGPPEGILTVEILGSTPVPVRGFTLGIGCDPKMLTLTGATVTAELAELVGVQHQHVTLVASQGKSGGIGDHLSIMCGFFKPAPGGVNLDAVIPHMTPMVRLELEIAADVPKGIRIALDNRAAYYGRRTLGPDGRVVQILIDNHYVATPREYLRTKLQSGWVDVR